jgi:hypothetical protein
LCDGTCSQNPYFHFHLAEPQGSVENNLGNTASHISYG